MVRPQPGPVALRQLLDQIAREAALLAGEKGLQLHYRPSQLNVLTDERLLKRVIQNLVSNAIRYTPAGKIVLGVRRCRDAAGQLAVRIEVHDTGVGIDPAVQSQIFQEFQQGPQADHKGLGIGLAISQRIAVLLQHPLTLHSRLGFGSCFAVQLPVTLQATLTPQSTRLIEPGANFTGKRILLLDNEPQLLSAVAELLRSWHCDVLAISQPNEAIRLLQQGPAPDLLLFDYHLDQGATGVEVASQLQQHFGVQCPVVIHSADQQQQTRDHALNAGFHFMLKPLKAATLKRLLQRLLR